MPTVNAHTGDSPDGAPEESIRIIRSASPSWDSFTNIDGTGLYHEIMQRICENANCSIKHTYTTATRGVRMVISGEADVYTCRDVTTDVDLILGDHPMYASDFHVFFLKSMVPDWRSPKSMKGKSTAWRMGYYQNANLPVPVRAYEAYDGTEALQLVLNKRIDFYLDDAVLIRQSMRKLGVEFDPVHHRIEKAGKRAYYPMFKNTPRGRALKRIFDNGLIKLRDSGELKILFEKWNHPYPY